MISKINKNKDRLKRHKRVRAKIKGATQAEYIGYVGFSPML